MDTKQAMQILIASIFTLLVALGAYELGRHSASNIVEIANGASPQVNINPR